MSKLEMIEAEVRGLPPHFQQRIEAKISELGRRLENLPPLGQ
ncbi:MAG TPA: hypothetical protein P5186_21255 [Candidatus Paceibacterota bacterium]|nr:hypothetical protein [Candidatus Paceibacterota bacterium]HRZ58585.1 hypothetical protein [Candidatus Paceibacterota bacterium]